MPRMGSASSSTSDSSAEMKTTKHTTIQVVIPVRKRSRDESAKSEEQRQQKSRKVTFDDEDGEKKPEAKIAKKAATEVKPKRITFDEDDEGDSTMLDAPAQDVADSEKSEESDDDDAPEAVSTKSAQAKEKERESKRRQAEAELASKEKQKRKERDAKLKKQAEQSKRRKREEQLKQLVSDGDASNELSGDDEDQESDDSEKPTSKLLPMDILEDAAQDFALGREEPKKHKKFDEEPKALVKKPAKKKENPTFRKGPVKVKVLQTPKKAMAPKAVHNAARAKDMLIRGRGLVERR